MGGIFYRIKNGTEEPLDSRKWSWILHNPINTTSTEKKQWCEEVLHFPAVPPQGLECFGYSWGKMRETSCLAIADA